MPSYMSDAKLYIEEHFGPLARTFIKSPPTSPPRASESEVIVVSLTIVVVVDDDDVDKEEAREEEGVVSGLRAKAGNETK